MAEVTKDIRDLLLEASRYAASDPETAAKLANRACGLMPQEDTLRIRQNIGFAMRMIRTDPDVFRFYCYCASFELLSMVPGICRCDKT